MPQTPTVIFLHIPKTAGTTMHSIFEKQYPPAALYSTYPANHPHGSLEEYAALPPERKAEIRVLLGHFSYGVHEMVPAPYVYITILREPIDRMISNFYHIKRDPNHGLYELVSSGQMDMKAYVEHMVYDLTMDNEQTRMFAGNWDGRGHGPCTDSMLETAKANLRDHFSVVGVTNRFDETYLLSKRLLGWSHRFYTSRNVTKNRPRKEDLPPSDLALLEKYNHFDSQLYRYAQALLQEQIAQQGPDFARELRLYRLLNALFNVDFIGNVYRQLWKLKQTAFPPNR